MVMLSTCGHYSVSVEYFDLSTDAYIYRVFVHSVQEECCHKEEVGQIDNLQFSFLDRELQLVVKLVTHSAKFLESSR